VAEQATRVRRRAVPAPRLADGVELIGEYEGSGFKEAPHIARRGDGQVIQLTRLLHLVAEEIDGRRSYAEIGRAVSERFGRRVSAGNVQFLIDRRLRPLGLVAMPDGQSPKLKKLDPLLGLKLRTALVPEAAVQPVTRVFRAAFWPPLVVLALMALVALDGWLFFSHGIGPGLRAALYDPVTLLLVFGGVVVATAFHEVGHASACRYGGARPGVLGAGIYLVWPVFYCDVTDAYRLGKAGRLRTDLGGIYFNGLFALGCAGLYALTGWEPLLLLILLQHLAVLQQLLPFVRLDGYYVLSDLTGVPDILTRIRPILRGLLPGRAGNRRVDELKPWVRVVVTLYVLVLIPLLAAVLVLAVVSAPRLFATAYDSAALQADRASAAIGDGQIATAAVGGIQALFVVLPCLGLALVLSRFGARATSGVAGWARGRPARLATVAAAGAAAVAFAAGTWWPNGDYEPLREGERVTLTGVPGAIADVPSGRASYSPERESRYGHLPTERERVGSEPGAPRTGTPVREKEAVAPGPRQEQEEDGVRPGDEQRVAPAPEDEESSEDLAPAPGEAPAGSEPEQPPPSGELAPDEGGESPPQPAAPPQGGAMQAPPPDGSTP
jgi:putative peptide zinc metalloprotease protein